METNVRSSDSTIYNYWTVFSVFVILHLIPKFGNKDGDVSFYLGSRLVDKRIPVRRPIMTKVQWTEG